MPLFSFFCLQSSHIFRTLFTMKPVKFPFRKRSGNTKVTVYRHANPLRPDGVEFKVAFYDAEGKRRFASFTDFDSAHAKAKEILALAARGELEAIKLTRVDLADYTKARRLLAPLGVSMAEAAVEYAKARNILRDCGVSVLEAVQWYADRHQVGIVSRPVQEVVAEMIERKRVDGLRERSLQDLRARCRRFAKAFPNMPLDQIKPEYVEQWLDGLNVGPQSRVNYIRNLHTLLVFAAGRNYVPADHGLLSRVERPKVTSGEIEVWTPDEIRSLLDNVPADFLPALAIQAFAGLRSQEIERLAWSDIDLPGGHITVNAGQAKTASRRVVPICPILADWLAPYAGRTGLVWTGTHRAFYAAQQETAKAAGLSWKPNACRHSWISCRLAVLSDVAKVAYEAGNSPAMVHRHYHALVKPAEAEAYFAVRPARPANVILMHAAEQ